MQYILSLLIILLSACGIVEASSGKIYTCTYACNNYKKCGCKSDLDKYNCVDVCNFAKTTGMISQKQLNCVASKTTCKEMFLCMGYIYNLNKNSNGKQ